MLRWVIAAILATCGSHAKPTPAPAGPSRISDDDCRARGGEVVTQDTYAHLRRARGPHDHVEPFRICRFPSPTNEATCRGDDDCAGGHCFCTGALARPEPDNDPALRALDGTAATGQCSDRALPDGEWFCLVEGGTVHLAGIIVD